MGVGTGRFGAAELLAAGATAAFADLSAQGAGVLLNQPLPPETFCILLIKTTAGDRRYELLGRVMHATTRPTGDWLIGCQFIDPLTADDLDALL